jgi:type VI secretion system protein ImpK
MAHDDPFADLGADRTVVLPAPGARAPASRPVHHAPLEEPDEATIAPSGLNPLIAAANPMLNLIPQIRSQIDHPNPEQLRRDLSRAMRDFDQRARGAGMPNEHVVAARYMLCTVLDETVAGTPWGSQVWSARSLLVEFHNETRGGEKVFALLSRLAENPAGNRNVLELAYVCLALGFEGRYRVLDGGRAQLETVRLRLYELLRKQLGEPDRALSPHWKGLHDVRARGAGSVPIWVSAAVCALLLAGVYLFLAFELGRRSDRLAAEIAAIRVSPAVAAWRPQPAAPSRLAHLLTPEVEQGLLQVVDRADRSVITVRGDGLFEPGSDAILDRHAVLLERIGEVLRDVPGRIEVAGHSDDMPIRTLRFPSNWELSQARAESVMELLAAQVAYERMRAAGRADTQPVAPNDTAQGRALNRRVDITLFAAPAAGGAQ